MSATLNFSAAESRRITETELLRISLHICELEAASTNPLSERRFTHRENTCHLSGETFSENNLGTIGLLFARAARGCERVEVQPLNVIVNVGCAIELQAYSCLNGRLLNVL